VTSTDTALYNTIDSPLGELLLIGDGEALTGLHMRPDHPSAPTPGAGWRREPGAFRAVAEQLRAYFAGELRQFKLALAPSGTEFQEQVWAALREIPYGRTVSYAELAAAVGRPGAARAVGAANGRNPISIVIPCHRVVGSAGVLTGYGGGIERKRRLLELEAAARARSA
jgi:methylated-DNA-[protein]-cysteine S-methyltransferase